MFEPFLFDSVPVTRFRAARSFRAGFRADRNQDKRPSIEKQGKK